jgi:hypothetical protein
MTDFTEGVCVCVIFVSFACRDWDTVLAVTKGMLL